MNRLKLLAVVALLGIPLAACEEATPPPPVGSIVGTVSIEGTGIDGVSVNLSNGNSTTTSGGGSYRFDNVQGGAYTVTISGFPSDATFDATSAAATISSAGQSVTVNFTGAYIRTASVMGTVTVENMGLSGVTVMLSGVSSASAVTDASGQYAFTGLRMGSYSVEISGFDSDEVGFSSTAASVSVGVGESKIVSFDGTYLRTAGIMGTVSVDGEGLPNVTVSLAGGPDNADMTTTTDAAGQYSFAKLRAGNYAVGISGYDTDDYEFEVTSQSVTVALGETRNVPFEGVLLRTSGISGRVSVEGMGLEGVTVTLSGGDMDEDMTAMTDAGGTYAFAGLAAGDYTVSIAVEGNAYVFESMSMDVTVGDDDTQIVNFEGAHATTASVSGMLFIDELMKNDMYDEGEDPLPHAGVPVVLVGPGVNDQMPSATDETGAYSFMGLKAGDYQLVVPVTEPMGDFAYGGSATGYALSVGVGEAVTQNLPIDITHTTVHFGVTLKGGDMRGMPLPGAMVTLYADAMGETKVGEGMTMVDEETMHAVASIRVARAGTTGNMVYAGVAAEGYHVADGMTTVMWDPQKTYTQGANDNNVLNLNVDVSVSGATIMTEAGGGEPLADWAISIAHGDVMEADTLDDDGMAAFKMELPPAAAAVLPKAFTFSVDTAQDSSLDGDEMFEATSFEYMHTGLALAGTVEGALEVKYTTQTLKVAVHQERDQVAGYTGNILDGDNRPLNRVITTRGHPDRGYDRGITLQIRHIGSDGRSHLIDGYENPSRNPLWGAVTFANVPADLDVVVQARIDSDRKIINDDEAQTYRDFESAMIMKGAFGEHGGFNHTVEACPETAADPYQDFVGSCSTFAYVWVRDVTGMATSQSVEFAENPTADPPFDMKTDAVAGIQVSLSPRANKNVQAESFGTATLAENPNTAAKELGTYTIKNVGDGQYRVSVSSGWRPGAVWCSGFGYCYLPEVEEEYNNGAFVPDDATINVVRNSVYIYGTVADADGIGVQDVEVSVGGQTATTDDYGRYIIADASHAWTHFQVSKAGYRVTGRSADEIRRGVSRRSDLRGRFNRPFRADFVLAKVTPTGTVSGTIKHLQSDAPLEGVRVFALKLDATAPEDLSMPGLLQVDTEEDADDDPVPVFTFDGVEFADVDTTDADGTFSVDAPAGALNGKTTTIIAYRSGMFFMPDRHITTVVDGGAYTLSFDGLKLSAIDGHIVDGDGNGMAGVTVTAVGGTTGGSAGVTREATTLASGRYNIRVPWGPYTVTPKKEAYSFDPASLSVTLAAEQVQTLQNFMVSADDNAAPAFSSPAAFSAAENQTAAGTVVAADADAGDDVTGYAITGGADMAMLSIDDMGALTFKSAPDFEMPGDADGMNDYVVEVTATSGTGARERTAMQEITVTVTDVDDDVTPQVTLNLAPTSIRENGGVSVVTATVMPAADAAFEVTVTAAGGGDNAATADDFTLSGSTLFFAAGATTATASATNVPVTITAVNNNDYTGDKTVNVSGSVTEASGVMAPAEASVLTIMDDDEANVVSLKLSRASIDEADNTATTDVTENASVLTAEIERTLSEDLTVTVTVVGTGFDGTAGGLSDDGDADTENTFTGTLTITAGETSSGEGTASEITITASEDNTDVMDHTVMISGEAAPPAGLMQPEAVTLTIVDDDDAPDAIADLGATAPAASAATSVDITLTWTNPTNLGSLNGTDGTTTAGETTTVTYQYRTKTSGQANYGDWASITPADGTGANAGKQVGTVTGVAVDNTYNYQVRIVIGSDATSAPSSPESNTADVVVAPATTE